MTELRVAIAGNPNAGKTTLFNRLTGLSARVGNYPGVTVDRRTGLTVDGSSRWLVHDLPGCYSLVPASAEEEIAHHVLTGRYGDDPFDAVIVAIDPFHLSRSLYLLLQVAELGLPVVATVNMMDDARHHGLVVDMERLRAGLGCPVVGISARTGEGLEELYAAVDAVLKEPTRGAVTPTGWSDQVSAGLGDVEDDSDQASWLVASRVDVLEGQVRDLAEAAQRAAQRGGVDLASLRRRLIEERYERLDALAAEAVTQQPKPRAWTERLDAVLLHPVAGVALFLVVMTVLFQAMFAWSDPFIEAIDGLGGVVGGWLSAILPAGLFRSVMIDGVLAGVIGTLVFIPQIAVLFIGVSLLEDTGYLARTAFLIDRLMSKVGLPGKSFVPLLSSFACNVPGIMSARTIPGRNDRLITMLVAPLMTCAARLPVFAMVIAAVFAGVAPVWGWLSVGGLLLTSMYLLGIVLALLTAALLRRTLLKGESAPLLLELPPYRLPRVGNVARVVGARLGHFLLHTGTIIVALTVVLWALMTFPKTALPAAEVTRLEAAVHSAATPMSKAAAVAARGRAEQRHQLEHSAAGQLGHLIEPVIAPLGFDWRIGIGLIGSLAAREVLIPVMGQVYGRGEEADDEDAYQRSVGSSMVRFSGLTPLVGLSLMVFFAIAMQCLSTVAVLQRETRSWRWPVLSLIYLNGLAYLSSLAVYQIGTVLGFQ